jgi:hypothetical protein
MYFGAGRDKETSTVFSANVVHGPRVSVAY